MLKDAAGRQHYQAGSGARIVSLVPSLTELLFKMDLQRQLVGRTSACVEPDGLVDQIDVIGSTRTIDIMKLAELGPSHVVVSHDDTPGALIEEIVNLGVEVVQTHCEGPEDNGALFELLGGIFGRDEQAGEMKTALDSVIAAAKTAAAERPDKMVLYLTWKNPWITVSRETYTARLLAVAGLRTLGDEPGKRYPQIEIDGALLRQADLVLFGNEPFQFEDEDIQEFQLEYGIGSKPRLEITDGRSLVWLGTRAIESMRELTRLASRL